MQIVFTYPVDGHEPGVPVNLPAEKALPMVRAGVAHHYKPEPAAAPQPQPPAPAPEPPKANTAGDASEKPPVRKAPARKDTAGE